MKPAAYAKLRAEFDKAEAALVRASRAYDNVRTRLRRADKKLDKEMNSREGGPEADLRKFPVEGSKAEIMKVRKHVTTREAWRDEV